MHEFGRPAWLSLSSRFWANHLYAYSETGPVNQYVQTHETQYSCLAWPVREGKMSAAPVWFWGGSYRTARKTALTEASVCVIVGLQEERVGEMGEERMQKERGEEGTEKWWQTVKKKGILWKLGAIWLTGSKTERNTSIFQMCTEGADKVGTSLSGAISEILIRGPSTWGYMSACLFASRCPKCPFVKEKFYLFIF